jgi:Anti-sigma factor NepR
MSVANASSPKARLPARLPSGARPQAAAAEPEPLPTLIGEQLRRYYASLLSEPIPPRFLALLRRLDFPKGDA